MAEKGFGVKEINLIGASGTPTIESPNNLNLNANNVAISTNVSIGGTLSVTGNVSVGGTFTLNDVTNIDSVGIITARSVIHAGAGLTVTGITTFRSDVNFGDYLGGNGAPIITFDESGDLLWFKKQTAGGSSAKIGLGGGISYDHLQLQQTYTGGGQSEITAFNSNILIATSSSEKNITLQSTNDITLANSVYPFIKCEENSSTDQSVTLYYGQTGSTPYANPKLETTNTGIDVTGAITVNGSATTAWTVGHNGASNYLISGPGGLNNATNPDLYLERGQTYQFIMNASGHGFGIQTSSGTWNNSNAYTTGITNPGADTGTITFQVPYSAPARLYYACTSGHSGMVGNIYLRGAGGQQTNVGVTTFTGIINSTAQAGFYARLNSNMNDKTGDGTYYTVQWDTDSGSVCYDQHSSFDTSTGLYQIPTGGDGVYQFSTAVCLSSDVYGRQGEAWFLTNTGLRVFFDRRYFDSTTGTITGFYGSCLLKLTAGQTVGVQVFVNGGSKNVDVLGAGASDHISWFTGRKIA